MRVRLLCGKPLEVTDRNAQGGRNPSYDIPSRFALSVLDPGEVGPMNTCLGSQRFDRHRA
jgi:hypothetical protein